MDSLMNGFSNLFGRGSNDEKNKAQSQNVAPEQSTKINITEQDMADLPMHDDVNHFSNKSPVGAINRYWNMLLKSFKPNLKKQFAENLTRPDLSEEEELDPEKSKSFLPTVGRALKDTLPKMIGGFISMLAELLGKLLSFFKVDKPIRTEVTNIVKTVGQGLFSGNPGEGLQNIATKSAPILMQSLNKMFNLGLSQPEMEAAMPFPTSATFTPKANAQVNVNQAGNQNTAMPTQTNANVNKNKI